MFGFFMSLMDATIVNLAIANIQKNLNTNLITVSWVLSAYNLVFASLLIPMGRLADQFGRKRMFMLGMAVFSFGSLLCAISPSIEWLIGFRALQAIGAAALNPVSLAIITVVFPPQKRGAAIGVWGAAAGLAAAIGPILGGFLVENFDWRWIFFVNLPFCIVGLFMVWQFVPESKDSQATRAVDVPGFLTLTGGLFCLVLAIINGNDWGWSDGRILGLFAGAVVLLAAFFFVETRQKQPILDFSLFKIRSFSAANATIFLFSMGIQGAFLILVLYLINAQGYDELGAAYALLPLPIASFVVSAIGGRFSAKLNPRYQAIAGMVILTLSFFALFTLSADSGYLDIAWREVLVGIGMGLVFTSVPNLAVGQVPRNKLGVASGALNCFRQIGFALGVAILISLFSGQVKDNTTQAGDRAVSIVQQDSKLPQPVRDNLATNLKQNVAQQQNSGRGSSSNSQQFDLTTIADRIPNGQALKPELASLGQRIGNEFKTAVVDAFRITWLVSAIISLLGIIPALATTYVRPARVTQEGSEKGDAPIVVDMA
jgi:EmrB/QacA subfamily drug resistance transporter